MPYETENWHALSHEQYFLHCFLDIYIPRSFNDNRKHWIPVRTYRNIVSATHGTQLLWVNWSFYARCLLKGHTYLKNHAVFSWGNVFKNGLSKLFKGYFPQNSLSSFLNNLSQLQVYLIMYELLVDTNHAL